MNQKEMQVGKRYHIHIDEEFVELELTGTFLRYVASDDPKINPEWGIYARFDFGTIYGYIDDIKEAD